MVPLRYKSQSQPQICFKLLPAAKSSKQNRPSRRARRKGGTIPRAAQRVHARRAQLGMLVRPPRRADGRSGQPLRVLDCLETHAPRGRLDTAQTVPSEYAEEDDDEGLDSVKGDGAWSGMVDNLANAVAESVLL